MSAPNNTADHTKVQSFDAVVVDPEAAKPVVAQRVQATYKDIFFSFVLMGWTAFGGPAAHLGIFQKTFVETKNWMSITVFNELLSLGQCLPGPTSTQVSFAIGVTQKGIAGGLMSGMLFQYPGLLMMSLAGAGAAEILVDPADWLRGISAGLSAAGVALVVSAAVGLANGQCKDHITSRLCLMSAVVAYYYQSNWIFPLLIVIGGSVTSYTKRNDDLALKDKDETIHHLGLNKTAGACLVLAWIAILATVTVLTNTTDYADAKELHWFEAFFRTGSIIFGGGQVVLPLLLKDVVQYESVCTGADGFLIANQTLTTVCATYTQVPRADSWITEEQFFAGLGVVQAMPGPLFNLAAYIGAVAARRAGVNILSGIAVSWFGLFGPGIMLIYGVLPFWGAFRKQPIYRRALPGLNSSAVGLVVAAVFQMAFKVREISPFKDASVVIGIVAFFAVHFVKVPPNLAMFQAPATILAGGVAGVVAWAAGCT